MTQVSIEMQYKVYADIRGDSSGWGVKRQCGCRRQQFPAILVATSWELCDENVIIYIQC